MPIRADGTLLTLRQLGVQRAWGLEFGGFRVQGFEGLGFAKPVRFVRGSWVGKRDALCKHPNSGLVWITQGVSEQGLPFKGLYGVIQGLGLKVLTIRGYLFGRPENKDYSISGSMLKSP